MLSVPMDDGGLNLSPSLLEYQRLALLLFPVVGYLVMMRERSAVLTSLVIMVHLAEKSENSIVFEYIPDDLLKYIVSLLRVPSSGNFMPLRPQVLDKETNISEHKGRQRDQSWLLSYAGIHGVGTASTPESTENIDMVVSLQTLYLIKLFSSMSKRLCERLAEIPSCIPTVVNILKANNDQYHPYAYAVMVRMCEILSTNSRQMMAIWSDLLQLSGLYPSLFDHIPIPQPWS